ncbi:MAG: class I SAM-dependent methyltransferase [Verrucomicrobiota bacterium]|jgi:SAM-dependent methyltransferase
MSKEYNQNAVSEDFEFRALREAVNYKRLLVKEFSAFVRGRALEVGSGIGQMTAVLRACPSIQFLQCVEPESAFCEQFRNSFPDQPLIQGMIRDAPGDDWDAIVSVNVLEHIEQDVEELALYHQRLIGKRGVLALFVPARPELYGQVDRDFGHYRRYGRSEVVSKITKAGFQIEKIRYFDFVGYFGWLIICRLLRQSSFKPKTVRLFDRLIFPLENFVETRICPPPIGKNLLVVARAT